MDDKVLIMMLDCVYACAHGCVLNHLWMPFICLHPYECRSFLVYSLSRIHSRLANIEATIMPPGRVTFSHVAGLTEAKQTLQEAIVMPLLYPHLFTGKPSQCIWKFTNLIVRIVVLFVWWLSWNPTVVIPQSLSAHTCGCVYQLVQCRRSKGMRMYSTH